MLAERFAKDARMFQSHQNDSLSASSTSFTLFSENIHPHSWLLQLAGTGGALGAMCSSSELNSKRQQP